MVLLTKDPGTQLKLVIMSCSQLKGSLGAAVKLLPCDHEVMGSSPGNSLLQKCRERLRTLDPKWLDPSLDPAQAGATCTGLPLFLFAFECQIKLVVHSGSSCTCLMGWSITLTYIILSLFCTGLYEMKFITQTYVILVWVLHIVELNYTLQSSFSSYVPL